MERGRVLMVRIFALLILVFVSTSQATECDVELFNFPNSNCSFAPPFEAGQLKFGNLDAVFSSGNVIRIGVVRFTIASNVEIFDAADPNCEYNDARLNDAQEGQEIAFKVNETNSREITKVWLLGCTVETAR